MAWNYQDRRYVNPGETVRMELAWSEAAMHMQVAGKIHNVTLLPSSNTCVAQILTEDGSHYSFPILYGEAGFYRDEQGRYYYYAPQES